MNTTPSSISSPATFRSGTHTRLSKPSMHRCPYVHSRPADCSFPRATTVFCPVHGTKAQGQDQCNYCFFPLATTVFCPVRETKAQGQDQCIYCLFPRATAVFCPVRETKAQSQDQCNNYFFPRATTIFCPARETQTPGPSSEHRFREINGMSEWHTPHVLLFTV